MNEKEQRDESRTEERLTRFLAHTGVASRRHAEALITARRVCVNGVVVTVQGTRIDPEHDLITVDGKPVRQITKHIYLLLHKPVGYLSTAHDPEGRPTVLDLLPRDIVRLRVYPVGRLDLDTSGLQLLTNDGDFALRLSHPRYTMDKHYEALVRGRPSERALEVLRSGVDITEDDGSRHRTFPAHVCQLRQVGADTWLALTIHEGRKRQIRRMLVEIGHPVVQLVRVGIGPLTLGGVPSGKWRYLTDAEVQTLVR